jgi:uncharacterized protein (TIGR02596 family)
MRPRLFFRDFFGPSVHGGFSLLELLVVMTIIILLAVLAGPSVGIALRGNRLTQATDTIVGVLNVARQSAVSRNQTVEVRFYCYTNPEMPGDTGQCHALQLFIVDDSGNYTPQGTIKPFPQSVVVTTNTNLSSLFGITLPTGSASPIPRVGTNYTYTSFQYYRSGATSLRNASFTTPPGVCITVGNMLDVTNTTSTTTPTNYATILIDPYNGSVKTFRPTL